MPSIQDMIEMTDLLRVKSIAVCEDRCSVVRNRNASCTACMDACIGNAIEVSRNEFSLNPSACVNCGVCTTVCPSSTLHTLEPAASKVFSDAMAKGNLETGLLAFACARRASKHEADDSAFVEVPCLGHLDETLLLECAAAGYTDIVLVDGVCGTCKYGKASPYIDEAVSTACTLAEAVGGKTVISCTSEFPPELLGGGSARKNLRGRDRRGLLLQTGSYVKQVASNVALKTVEDKLGLEAEKKTLRQRLGATASGRMPTFEPNNNYALLDCMSALTEAAGIDAEALSLPDSSIGSSSISTRHFGNIEIDTEKCSGCGMCVLFCPTGALSYSQYDIPENPDMKYVEFQASMCDQCNLCADVCIRKCLKVSPEVKISDLFGFEPELIEISKPKEKASIFDFNRKKL